MHDGQVEVDDELVHRLIAGRMPQWSDLPVTEVRSDGTVNAVYRLGDDLSVRLPLLTSGVEALEHELRWLPWLAERLSVPVPEPVATGAPAGGYPFPWAVYRWLPGTVPDDGGAITDAPALVDDLAGVVHELRALPADGAPVRPDRCDLRAHDPSVQVALRHMDPATDPVQETAEAWAAALAAPPHDGPPTWVHGDLFAPNVLVARRTDRHDDGHDLRPADRRDARQHGDGDDGDGRVGGVLDWGCSGLGDPAADLALAWWPFVGAARDRLRTALAVDDDTWARSRGWVLRTAILGIPYYRRTNPGFVVRARHALDAVLWGERATEG